MSVRAYPCQYKVPENGTLDGYKNVKNSTCTYCDEMCQAPQVDSTIKFMDGFKKKLVLILYLVFGLFSIIYQTIKNLYFKPKEFKKW